MCRSNIQLDIHVKDKCSMFLRRPLFMGSNNKIRMLEVLRDSELRLRGIPPAPTFKLVFWSRKADGSKNKSFFYNRYGRAECFTEAINLSALPS